MPESIQPNIGDSLVRIHRVITRALDTVVDRSAYFSQNGFPVGSARDGFRDYVRSLSTVLRAHHLSEDEVAFPYFRMKVPDAPYDRLIREHQILEGRIAEIDAAINGFEKDGDVGRLGSLHDTVQAVRDFWGSHIGIEEEWFSAVRLSGLMDVGEHMRLGGSIMEHNQRHSEPGYLIAPFILYNLSGSDRERMSNDMPSAVSQRLVPVVWKEKWAPMKPFLLP